MQAKKDGVPAHGLPLTPDLRQRSHQEMVFGALVLQTMEDQVTAGTLATCLHDGDTAGKVDIVVECGVRLAIEWDGGYYHQDDRIESDVRKTTRVLEQDPEIRVIRVRAGAPRIKELEAVDRCVLVYVGINATPIEAMHAFADAVRSILPEPYTARLQRQRIPLTQDRAVEAVVDLRYACDAAFKAVADDLGRLFGDVAARNLSRPRRKPSSRAQNNPEILKRKREHKIMRYFRYTICTLFLLNGDSVAQNNGQSNVLNRMLTPPIVPDQGEMLYVLIAYSILNGDSVSQNNGQSNVLNRMLTPPIVPDQGEMHEQSATLTRMISTRQPATVPPLDEGERLYDNDSPLLAQLASNIAKECLWPPWMHFY